MVLPPYYLEIMLDGGVVFVDAMMMHRGGFLKVLFESFSKSPRGSPVYSSSHVWPHIGTSRWPYYC